MAGDAHLHEAAQQFCELAELRALEAGRIENVKQYAPGLEKYNDNAVSYRYFYITITNEACMITNEN